MVINQPYWYMSNNGMEIYLKVLLLLIRRLTMSNLNYLNKEGSFGVVITDKMVNDIFEKCKETYPNETGGILIGHYSMNLKRAHITIITGASRDSNMGKLRFHRGANGLQRL
jgi:hypothetical protein